MKFRGGQEKDEVKLQLTSMIDIVFLLLAYFIMTFKITALEGDFLINMPMGDQTNQVEINELDNTIYVYLQENPATHQLQTLQIRYQSDEKTYVHEDGGSDAFGQLHAFIRDIVERDADPSEGGEKEVEIETDFDLAYGETIRAIEAVSARLDENNKPVQLIEKIRFKDARRN